MLDLLLAAMAALPPADPVFEDLPRGIRAKLRVSAPCETAYRILADHDSYPEFMPSVRAVRTVRKGPGWADVAFEYQRGEGAVQHRTYDPPEGIRWRLQSGEGGQVKAMSGFWGFSEVSGAAAASCMVTYELRVEPRLPVPGAVVTRFVRPIVERTVDAVGHRISSGGTWKKSQK